MNAFISGMTAMGMLASSLFFFRFWREARDRLFLLFAIALLLLAAGQALRVFVHGDPREAGPGFYLIRLAAYGLVLAAIVVKNLPPSWRSRRG